MNFRPAVVAFIPCLAVCLVGVALAAVPARTTSTFIVNSTLDATDASPGDGLCESASGNGICTLRAAIQEANAQAGADSITLPTGIYSLTLKSGTCSSDIGDCAGDLDITGTLTLIGAGANETIIDGGGAAFRNRVFQTWAPSAVEIVNVTIRNGQPLNTGAGGGVFIEPQSVLTLTQVVVSGNSSYGGGGIANGGRLTLLNSLVSNNSSTSFHGGGISNGSGARLTLISTHVTTNTAAGFGGGGVAVSSGATAGISTSLVSGNTVASGPGGGLYNDGTLVVYSSVVVSNTAWSGSGGGIYNGGGLTIDYSTIRNNSGSSAGGGIVNGYGGNLNISHSAIHDNTSSFRGGGVSNSGSLNLSSSTVSGNSATTHGGGLFNSGTAYLNNVTLTSNTADQYTADAEAGDGGGVYQEFGAFNFMNTLIGGNVDTSGEAPDCGGGSLNSQDYNLIQNTTGCAIGGTTAHNLTGQDPKLGPLENNGGATYTHALLDGSPAIDAGGDTCTVTDQRGLIRLDGNGDATVTCDMGAYEFGYKVGVHLPVVMRAP